MDAVSMEIKKSKSVRAVHAVQKSHFYPGGHSTIKNMGGWLDSLGSEILVGKDILGFFKNIDLDNS